MKSNIDTSRDADINFSCLLCLRRQRLQKIYISNTVAFLGYFYYSLKIPKFNYMDLTAGGQRKYGGLKNILYVRVFGD